MKWNKSPLQWIVKLEGTPKQHIRLLDQTTESL
jgi:hypothetical protein